MRGPAIDLELLGHGPTETVLGEHALDGPLDDALRIGLQHLLGADLAEPADVTSVPAVLLGLEIAPREMDLLGIEDHDVVADVAVRRKDGLVLTAQDRGDPG